MYQWIDFCKSFLMVYPKTKLFSYNFKDTEDYVSLDEFYLDIDIGSYKLDFTPINYTELEALVEDGRVFLFQIKNRDYNDPKNKQKGSRKNLHTLYWQSIFSQQDNRPKLNGEAELFYRK